MLQRAPAEPAEGEDWCQTLCFSFSADAAQAAAAAWRHAAAAAKAGKTCGSVVGSPLGAEGVQEWRQRAERCVLYDNGTCVAQPEEGATLPTARPLTALVAA